MVDPNAAVAEPEEELVDYEEEDAGAGGKAGAEGGAAAVKKGYVGIHSSGFKDFLLKPELLRAIVDCGFEHPSEGARKRMGKRVPARRVCLASFPPSHPTPPPFPTPNSPARVHPASHPGHGRAVPSQVGHGQDGRVCAVGVAAAGARGRRGGRRRHLPHARAGVPGERKCLCGVWGGRRRGSGGGEARGAIRPRLPAFRQKEKNGPSLTPPSLSPLFSDLPRV